MIKRLLFTAWLFSSTGLLLGQAPFICDGDFFLSLTPSGQGSVSTFYQLSIDPLGTVNFSQLLSSPGLDAINAVGHRSTDNFVYGVNPNTHALYRIDSLGTLTFLAFITGIDPNSSWLAGDCSPDGQYLVISGNDGTSLIQIDLTSPT
ncbi:MAG: hypothetical protein AAF804_09105, partial [Bacteroidota bacterium]